MAGAGTAGLAGCLGLFELPEEDPMPEDSDADPDDEDPDDDPDDTADDDPAEAGEFAVEFLRQEATIDVPEDGELLYAGLDEGWDLPYQCEVGVCGVCEAQVDGNGHDLVEMTANEALSDDEVEDGRILTCTAQPRDDFAIDTHPDDNGLIDDVDEDDEAAAFDIEFLEQGETIEVPDDEELLYAGLDEGWDLPYQCEAGVCGVCEAQVDGNGHDLVEMTANDALSDDEVEGGRILTCTAQPRDDFAVDTHPE